MEPIQIETKQCGSCKEVKPVTAFNLSSSKSGYHHNCKTCRKIVSKETYRPNPLVAREQNLKRMYGITQEHYQEMFLAQNGKCAVCKQPETDLDTRTQKIANLHIDHDHKTGKVRALLCRGCNTAYGQLNEDPDRIRMLLKYAEDNQV